MYLLALLVNLREVRRRCRSSQADHPDGIELFLIGSVLYGFASTWLLIAFRVDEGLAQQW